MSKTLTDQVQDINALLEFWGAKAVQKKPSLGNRPELYGFIPQFVFDATNTILGPGGWSHTVGPYWHTEKQSIVQVTVTIAGASHTQFGESPIVKPKSGQSDGDIGSAVKGAVTDAVQKCLALFGIGGKAYRGELKNVYQSGTSGKLPGSFPSALYGTLCEEAKALGGDIEKGRTFWRTNGPRISALSESEKTDLAKVLQGIEK